MNRSRTKTNTFVLSAILLLTASLVQGGSGPIPDQEVRALIEKYSQRTAVEEASAPEAAGDRECPKFTVVDPSVIAQQGTWLAMGVALEEASGVAVPPKDPTDVRLVPYVDYSGDLWTRPKLTGDWGGWRKEFMDKGVRFDIDLTQTYMGVISGGRNTQGRYGGLLDMKIQLDTGKAGLWPGGLLNVRAQSQFGEFGAGDSGQLLPYNTNGLFPFPGKSRTALTSFYHTQFVAPWLAFVGGKVDLTDFLSNHFQGGRGSDQFMNTALNANPAALVTCPLAGLGFGALVVLPDIWKREGVNITTMYAAVNPTEQSTLMPFNDSFEEGVLSAWLTNIPTNFFDLPGNQQFVFLYSSRNTTALSQDRIWLMQRVLGLTNAPPKEEDSSSAFLYSFTQYLWVKPGSKRESTGVVANTPLLQGIGIYGNFGCADPKTNPVEEFYAIGLSGRGLVPRRENDTVGAGFFYTRLSDELGPIIRRNTRDPYGVEVYYNVEITPWMHVTADLQILEPALKNDDTAVVAGVRMKLSF